jgi:hypothetical protein
MRFSAIAIVFLAFFVAVVSAVAEPVLNPFLNQSPQPEGYKSPSKAALFSLLLPGSGELYSEAKRGYLFLIAEVALIASYVAVDRKAEQLQDDYVAEVRANVGFDGIPEEKWPEMFDKWNMEDFEHATMFDNWRNVYTDQAPESEQGIPLERVGKFYWLDREGVKNEKLSEREHTSQLRQKALQFREDSNLWFKRAKMMIGGVVLNHIVSFVDARIAAKLHNKRLSLKTSMNLTPNREDVSLCLSYSF